MAKLMIEHDRPNCIGCGSCAAINPRRWKMNDDSKADIIGGKSRKDGWQELEISEDDLKQDKETAESCPVNVIHIKKGTEKII